MLGSPYWLCWCGILKQALISTLAISGHALIQKCGSDAMWPRAASSGMVAMPNGPEAPSTGCSTRAPAPCLHPQSA